MKLHRLMGKILIEKNPDNFIENGQYSFTPCWLKYMLIMMDEIVDASPRTKIYEIIEAETGLLDILFLAPAEDEEAIWHIIMTATEACASYNIVAHQES